MSKSFYGFLFLAILLFIIFFLFNRKIIEKTEELKETERLVYFGTAFHHYPKSEENITKFINEGILKANFSWVRWMSDITFRQWLETKSTDAFSDFNILANKLKESRLFVLKNLKGPSVRLEKDIKKPNTWEYCEPCKRVGKDGIPKGTPRCFPKNLEDYKKYIEDAVKWGKEHGIKAWQIANEPNKKSLFCGDEKQLAIMQKIAHKTIKSIDPEAIVVFPGFSGINIINGKESEGLKFFKNVLKELNGCEYFDAIDFHANYAFFPKDYLKIEERAKIIKSILSEYENCKNKQIWITEMGVGSGVCWERKYLINIKYFENFAKDFKSFEKIICYDFVNHASEIIKRFTISLANGINRIGFDLVMNHFSAIEFNLSQIKQNNKNFFPIDKEFKRGKYQGILFHTDLTPKPFVREAIKLAIEKFGDKVFVKRINKKVDKNVEISIYEFKNNKSKMFVIWCDSDLDFYCKSEVEIEVSKGTYRITNALGRTKFVQVEPKIEKAMLNLRLEITQIPIFVEKESSEVFSK